MSAEKTDDKNDEDDEDSLSPQTAYKSPF